MFRDGWDRNAIMQAIKTEGVPCFVGSCSEIYLEKAFIARRKHPRLPVAKLLGESSLMFLVHPTLSDEHIAVTCQAIESVIAKAVKCSSVSARSCSAAATINRT
jgi:dTDP-4-amino-4,6-dideoxygalactose transaminase